MPARTINPRLYTKEEAARYMRLRVEQFLSVFDKKPIMLAGKLLYDKFDLDKFLDENNPNRLTNQDWASKLNENDGAF